MYSLTHVFLYNWQHITNRLIPIDKTIQWQDARLPDWQAVLDALQFVLLPDDQRLTTSTTHALPNDQNFPQAVQQGIAYIALEFVDTENLNTTMTIGVCIEHRQPEEPTMCFLLIPESLDPEIFVPEGIPLNKQQLRQALRIIPEAKTFRKAADYRNGLLSALGGINQRFFSLFARGLAFTPICTTEEFVKTWLLDSRPLDVETLHQLGQPYAQLGETARGLERKLSALHSIVERQKQIRELRQQEGVYTVLTALLRLTLSERWLAEQERQIRRLTDQITQGRQDQEQSRAAQAAAEERLQQLDEQMRASPFMQRHDEIQREIRQVTSDASIIQSRWLTLLHDLRHQSTVYRPILSYRGVPIDGEDFFFLAHEERASLQGFLQAIATLSEEKPPDKSFFAKIDEAIVALDSALERALEWQYRLRHKREDLRTEGQALHQQYALLQQGGRGYPDKVERLCQHLTHRFGERPPLLCEVLDVREERWQHVVEALLDHRRFTVLVQTDYFARAQRVLHEMATKEGLTMLGVLHVVDTLRKSRPPLEGSLALQVEPLFPSLRPVVDMLLGEIIACESQDQLFRHRQAVTPDGVYYAATTLMQLPPASAIPWFIGQRAVKARIQACDNRLLELKSQLTTLSQHLGMINAHVMRLRHVRDLGNLRLRLDAPLDERPLRERITELVARQKGQETGEVAEIHTEFEHLRQTIAKEQQVAQTLTGHLATWEAKKERLQADIQETRRVIQEYNEQANEARARYPSAVAAAMELLPDYLPEEGKAAAPYISAESVRNLERTVRGYEIKRMHAIQQLIGEATDYNTRYHFVGRVDDADEARYAHEEHHLMEHVLPLYKDQVAAARQQAMDALRDYYLDPLRERFLTIKQQMERFNEALARLDPAGKRYRFGFAPNDNLTSWYHLIADSHVLNSVSVISHPLYQEHRSLFDQLYIWLTQQPQSEEERQEQARLLDYRSYFRYDVEVHHEGMATKHIGDTGKQSLADDSMVPYYLTIAATFAQLYHLNERTNRSMLRLVVFDRAFVGLDHESIATAQSIFDRLGLQLIIPPESILPLQQAQVDRYTPHRAIDPPPAL